MALTKLILVVAVHAVDFVLDGVVVTEFLENIKSGIEKGFLVCSLVLGLQNVAELGLDQGKGFRVPVAYSHPIIFRIPHLPPPPPLFLD